MLGSTADAATFPTSTSSAMFDFGLQHETALLRHDLSLSIADDLTTVGALSAAVLS